MKKPAKKPAPAAHPKPPPAWHPVPVATQRKRHRAAVRAAHTRAKTAAKGSPAGSQPAGKQPVKKQPAKKAVKRKLALGSAVACCSAEALAASLRLSGHAVSGADVLALYWHTARDEHAGASIVATLEAAAEFGLADMRPMTWECVNPGYTNHGIYTPGLILGLSLPAPHAVLDTGSEWVTWGEPWPAWAFPGAVIEEAWAVTW